MSFAGLILEEIDFYHEQIPEIIRNLRTGIAT